MSVPVTRTKVILPRRRSDLLTRPRLMDLVYDLLDYKLIIVAAPAGYGKTSLLVDFAHQVEMPVCWYAIDPLDRDPQRFIAHLIASFSQRFPSFGSQSKNLLDSMSQAKLDVNRILTVIVNEAYEHIHEHFLFVLDDYHMIDETKDTVLFINRFVQEVDENCHLVLSTRALPILPDMPLLVARSLVGGLSFDELAFRPEEIQSLALQNYRVTMSETSAKELAQETEGWITGLLLSSQAMWQGMGDRLRVARISGVGLYDYLAQQVLDKQPQQIRDFLLKTSLLEEFDHELCQIVFGSSQDWPALIQTILHNNLFVLPVGEDGRWIRYHHLFRDFLQGRLEKECPQEKTAILIRLATLYEELGEWEKSHEAYLKLGDQSAQAGLIERAGSSLLGSGRLVTLANWIDSLPEEILSVRPTLLSLRGAADVMLGQVEEGRLRLIQAEQASRQLMDTKNLAFTLARRATANRFLGDYQASLEDAAEALILAEHDEELRVVQAEALRATGMSLYQLGRITEATERLEQSLQVYEALGDRQNIATVMMELGLAATSAGRYGQALGHYSRSLDLLRELNNSVGQATLLNNMGVLQYLMGEYQKAGLLFEEALQHAKENGFTRMEAYILSSIGDLYNDLQAYQSAQEAYQLAMETGSEINDRFLLFYVQLAEASLARESKDFTLATNLIATARLRLEESNSSYEQGLWHLELGRLRQSDGRVQDAVEQFEEAALCFDSGGQYVEAARTRLYLANAYYFLGHEQKAFVYLGEAIHLSAGLDSQHVLVVAGQGAKELLERAQSQSGLRAQAGKLLKQVMRFERIIPALRRQLRPHASTVPFVPPKLTIYTFGKAQVNLDGEPVTAAEWQNQKRAREVFFYLLANPEGITKEELGLIFWPDSSPSQLRLQFKNAIYRLRYALGPNTILFDEDRYWFNREMDYDYDVDVFIEKKSKAQEAPKMKEKIVSYREAIDRYKGDYLPGYEMPWAASARERYWQLYVEAVLALARIYLEARDPGSALDYCQLILAGDLCIEEAHRLVMRAYAARGNRAAVARQFELCRQALLEEINAPPSLETVVLYEALMG